MGHKWMDREWEDFLVARVRARVGGDPMLAHIMEHALRQTIAFNKAVREEREEMSAISPELADDVAMIRYLNDFKQPIVIPPLKSRT